MRGIPSVCAMLLAVALCLSGCMPGSQEPEASNEISLPQPPEEPENMILGETMSNIVNSVTLYYAAQDGASFSSITRSVRAEAGQSLPEVAIASLLQTQGDGAARSMSDTWLLGCEYACGTVTVNLSIDARNAQSPQELLALQTSIGNTLPEIDGVRGVNVLIGGLSESYCQLPPGVQTANIASVTASYAQLQAERDRLNQADADPIERDALIYFPTRGGDWLVPELRHISARNGDFITALIDALRGGPEQESCAVSSIPGGVELLDSHPAIRTLSNGERALDLNFSSALANYLAFSGLDVWELAGSLTLTMCSFLPELDAVRVMVNGDPITMCEMGNCITTFEHGLIHRSDFSGRVGSVAMLYLVNQAGALQPVWQAVSTHSALSPRSLLSELLRCTSPDAAPRMPLPGGIGDEDILGVQTSGGLARVNLSANFYRLCQSLTPAEEYGAIYAMVNTLCQLESVRAVRFYVEGCAADTLAGGIYLKSILLPNPGVVQDSPSPVDDDSPQQ